MQRELINLQNWPIAREQRLDVIFGDQGGDKTPAVGNIVDPFSSLPVADDNDVIVSEEERLAVDSKDPEPVIEPVTEPITQQSSGSGISDGFRKSTRFFFTKNV